MLHILSHGTALEGEPYCALPLHFSPCEFRIKWAETPWERDQAHRLRRAVFCIEQGVFVGDDRDATDDIAQPIVALSMVGGMPDQVVGTVRIHLADPGVWWGSRLAVHPSFRKHGRLGATLIRLAVSSAHALGCERFMAQVQSQNEPLFRRLHWSSLKEVVLHGRSHHLMQADLGHYPPMHSPERGWVTVSRSAA